MKTSLGYSGSEERHRCQHTSPNHPSTPAAYILFTLCSRQVLGFQAHYQSSNRYANSINTITSILAKKQKKKKQRTAQLMRRHVSLLWSSAPRTAPSRCSAAITQKNIQENFKMALKPGASRRLHMCHLKVKCHSTSLPDSDLAPPPPRLLRCAMQFGAFTIAWPRVPCVLIIHLLQEAAPVLNKLTERVINAKEYSCFFIRKQDVVL